MAFEANESPVLQRVRGCLGLGAGYSCDVPKMDAQIITTWEPASRDSLI